MRRAEDKERSPSRANRKKHQPDPRQCWPELANGDEHRRRIDGNDDVPKRRVGHDDWRARRSTRRGRTLGVARAATIGRRWRQAFHSTAAIVIASIYAVASSQGATGSDAIVTLFQSSTTNVALLILAYLVVLGAFGLLAELILAYGWWRLLARSATVTNPDSVRTVRSTAEDRSLIGQGLADALNVGAY